jgi:hypothetical protein
MGNSKRFSMTMGAPDLEEIEVFCQKKGIGRNELMRRCTLAWIRFKESTDYIGIEDAWEAVGLVRYENEQDS